MSSSYSLGCSSSYRSLITPGEISPSGGVLVRDVNVFSATKPKSTPHQDVLIKQGEIASISPTGDPPPSGARVIDGRGKTLLPGFVDTHVHVSFSGATPYEDVWPEPKHNLEALLYSGVTTVYDLGGDASDMRKLKQRVERGELLGPRIFYTHIPITVPESHPVPVTEKILPWPINHIATWLIPQIESVEEADEVIAGEIERGIDYVKLSVDQLPPGTPEMSDDILRAAIQAAQRRGVKAVVHIGSIEKALVAAQAGAAALVHHTWRTPVSASEAEQLAATKVFYMATIAGWEAVAAMAEGRNQTSALTRETNPARVASSVTGERGREILKVPSAGDMSRFAAKMRPTWAPSLKRLYEAGVRFLIGTDAGVPGVFHGSSFHDELRILHEAGIPSAELLIAATARGAKWFNPQANFGTIEVGKVADIVIVRGDPLAEITATAQIEHVFVRGREIKRLPPPSSPDTSRD